MPTISDREGWGFGFGNKVLAVQERPPKLDSQNLHKRQVWWCMLIILVPAERVLPIDRMLQEGAERCTSQ